MRGWRCAGIAAALAAALWAAPAPAQSVVGSANAITVTTSSANAQVTADRKSFPVVVIMPAVGTNVEIFYALGQDNTVTATTGATNQVVPPGGMCIGLGPNSWIAAISTGSATLRITQMSTCPVLGKNHNPAVVPPPTCSNALKFDEGCNSQYLALLRL